MQPYLEMERGIHEKSRLVKSFAGPTGKVLAEKLPVGAFCPRKLQNNRDFPLIRTGVGWN